jgi:kynureninase
VTDSLASHYSRFRVGERLLLTGHSHQAWPDVGFAAQQRAWLDAAELVGDKWERSAEQAAVVRAGFARLLGDAPERIALGQNTHELVARWLSALPLRARPRIVTTDAEFHSLRRQLARLAEEGVDVVRVPAQPVDSLSERAAAALDDRTACAMVSSVLFSTSEIVPGLGVLAAACDRRGARLLVDAYHHLNVVPFDLVSMALDSAFITGGGYKYCQLGEGNCFLRVPPGVNLRPVLTGWFAAPEPLTERDGARVSYADGAGAFAGATYDPTSHYRAAAVFGFHVEQGLLPDRLRQVNRRQVRFLKDAFEALDAAPALAAVIPMPDDRRGGFLAIRAPRAADLVAELRRRGVHADARGDVLRMGPAPYLRDDQLTAAVGALGEVLAAT